jgi:hypothetical protein
MARSSEDLAALLMAGDEYTETVEFEFLNERFAVKIRPLTETELIDVTRSQKIGAGMLKTIANKVDFTKKFESKEEEIAAQEVAMKAVLEEGNSIDVGDLNYQDHMQNRAYCMAGIVDENLRALVPKFRYGLTELIAKRIKTISEVPPAVVANFFGVSQDTRSS